MYYRRFRIYSEYAMVTGDGDRIRFGWNDARSRNTGGWTCRVFGDIFFSNDETENETRQVIN